MVSANKNRIIRTLEDGNVKLSSVLSDTSGKTGRELIEMLCDGKELTLQDIEGVRHKRCHHTAEEMLEACTGYMNDHKRYMLQCIRECNRKLNMDIAELDFRIKTILAPFSEVVERLDEIPGLGGRTTEEVIAEIGLDMSQFPTAASLCKWAGMCPGNNESAGKKKSGKTPKGDKYIRATLVEAAWAASRTKGTFFSERFARLSPRRGGKKALVAVGHSILTAIHYVLSTGGRFKDLGDRYVPERTEKKRRDYLKSELKKLGYEVVLTKKKD
jgi:transposase